MNAQGTEAEGGDKIYAALAAVMGDVQQVRKDGKNQQQNYAFRGVDAVVNAVGPVLRKHGVVVLPRVVSQQHRDFLTDKGKSQHEAIVEVEYTFIAADGSFVSCSTVGESSDFSDKATTQAMSVAWRTALLQALSIPTDAPDPDESGVVRGGVDTPADSRVIATLKQNLEALPEAEGFRTIAKQGYFRMFGKPDELADSQAVRAVEYVAALTAIVTARAVAGVTEPAVSEPSEPARPKPPPPPPPPPQNAPAAPEAVDFKAIAAEGGLTQTQALRAARATCKNLGLEEPPSLDQVPEQANGDVLAALMALIDAKGVKA